MKQHSSRMIVEVNKLISNALIKDGGVYLPGVGSLSVVTTPLTMNSSSKEMSAPTREITISKEEKHRSLIVVITERGNCTPQQATQIYNKWYDVVVKEDNTTIEGVGKISGTLFTTDSALKEKLNPIAQATPQKVKKKGAVKKQKKRGGTILTLLLIAVAAAVALFILPKSNDTSYTTEATPTEQSAQPIEVEVIEDVTTEEAATEEVVEISEDVEIEVEVATKVEESESVESVQEQKQSEPTSQATYESTSDKTLEAALAAGVSNIDKPYNVIYGAYSVAENAEKAMSLAEQEFNEPIECTAYRYGSTVIISIYSAPSEAEAKQFVRENRTKFKEPLWVYKKK